VHQVRQLLRLHGVNFVKSDFLNEHYLLQSITATQQAREQQPRCWSHHMLKGRAGILPGKLETVEDREKREQNAWRLSNLCKLAQMFRAQDLC
jgi:hypothetical protein